MTPNFTHIGISLAISVLNRDSLTCQNIISAIAVYSTEEEAIKVVRVVLDNFTVDDREWFDEIIKNAGWRN